MKKIILLVLAAMILSAACCACTSVPPLTATAPLVSFAVRATMRQPVALLRRALSC